MIWGGNTFNYIDVKDNGLEKEIKKSMKGVDDRLDLSKGWENGFSRLKKKDID